MKDLGNAEDIAVRVGSLVCKNLGTPFATRAHHLISSGRHREYLDLDIKPSDYEEPNVFAADYLAMNLLRKFDSLEVDVDRKKVAIDKFLDCEEKCRKAGENLRLLRSGQIEMSNPRHWILHSARRKISEVLGPFNWDLASRFFSFGPGAAVGCPRRRSDRYFKYGSLEPSVTQGCVGLADAAILWHPMWFDHISLSRGDPASSFKVVSGNNVVTVPKNAKTDRVIAIEPLMNMYFQKGIGGLMRRRLKRVGVNLDSQRRNQKLAKFGSETGYLATVDLSAASDCVSLSLCQDLLPSDWMLAIEATRSPSGVLPDGSVVYYRKVSSMGNGFTFELESLIFWAISQSVVDFHGGKARRVAVYGDDIIVPGHTVPLLQDVLNFVGFEFNSEKSFSDGPFRESCGKHYFRGVDVTPLFIKTQVNNLERLFWLANSLKRLAFQHFGMGYGLDSRFKESYDFTILALPPHLRRPRAPLWLNGSPFNGAIGGDFDECKPPRTGRKKKTRGWCGWDFPNLIRRYRKRRVDGRPAILRWFSLTYRETDNTSIQLASYELIMSVSSTRQWTGTGPWF